MLHAIAWANVDPDLFRHTTSLGHYELISVLLYFLALLFMPFIIIVVFTQCIYSLGIIWSPVWFLLNPVIVFHEMLENILI